MGFHTNGNREGSGVQRFSDIEPAPAVHQGVRYRCDVEKQVLVGYHEVSQGAVAGQARRDQSSAKQTVRGVGGGLGRTRTRPDGTSDSAGADSLDLLCVRGVGRRPT